MYVLARVEALELHQPRMAESNAVLRDNRNDGVGFAAHKETSGSLSESNEAGNHAQDDHSASLFVGMLLNSQE